LIVDQRVLVLHRHRHLKWKALDPLEATLMVLCGISISGFTLSVLCDVVTRTIGYPWLWLQQVTTGFFAYGVFIGMAAATRRLDHLFLSEITKRLPPVSRMAVEIFNRFVVFAVAVAMVWFGYKNFLLDLGSFRMPSMIPLGTYTIIVPVSGALIALFAVEQTVNGWRHGFAGPEDLDDEPRVIV
jgi:TRAP-type C4-dicarboxylate transport system permease small subunit